MRLPGFSVLQRTPAWLQRRVLFHVWWLESFNRLTRHRLSWRTTTGVLGALGLVAWLAGYWGPSILGLSERHLLSAGVIVALQAAVLTGRSRRAWTEICAQGWLATLPLALTGRPSLIVLDEAFNGLDPASSLVLKRLLQDRLQGGKCAVLLATHALEVALAGAAAPS